MEAAMQEERNPELDEDLEEKRPHGHRPHGLDESDDEVEAHRFAAPAEDAERNRNNPTETGRRFGPDEPGRRF
jgi:hypothetical protein